MSYLSVAPNSYVNWSAHGPIVPGMLDRGMGDYQNVGDWTWEYTPGAYWWLRPEDSAPQPAPTLGMGCGCGGSCGGCGDHKHGLGLFDSTDISTWGVGEWSAIAVGLFIVGKLISGGRKATKAVKGYARRRARRSKALAAI
jgi:hypothetical protein